MRYRSYLPGETASLPVDVERFIPAAWGCWRPRTLDRFRLPLRRLEFDRPALRALFFAESFSPLIIWREERFKFVDVLKLIVVSNLRAACNSCSNWKWAIWKPIFKRKEVGIQIKTTVSRLSDRCKTLEWPRFVSLDFLKIENDNADQSKIILIDHSPPDLS